MTAAADKMAQALRDAMRSLETVATLSGKEFWPGTETPTHMGHMVDVRQYAANRAKVASEALAAYEQEQKRQAALLALTRENERLGLYEAEAPGNPLPKRIEAANARLQSLLKDAELDYVQADVPQPFVGPYRAGVGFHDALFVAVDDANGQRVAEIYDIESGAALVRRLNLSHEAEQAAAPDLHKLADRAIVLARQDAAHPTPEAMEAASKARTELIRALGQAAAPKAEVVGRCCYGGTKPKSACASCGAWKAAPQPATSEREALTEEQIAKLYHEHLVYQDGVTPSGLVRITRYIEQAHGITRQSGNHATAKASAITSEKGNQSNQEPTK